MRRLVLLAALAVAILVPPIADADAATKSDWKQALYAAWDAVPTAEGCWVCIPRAFADNLERNTWGEAAMLTCEVVTGMYGLPVCDGLDWGSIMTEGRAMSPWDGRGVPLLRWVKDWLRPYLPSPDLLTPGAPLRKPHLAPSYSAR